MRQDYPPAQYVRSMEANEPAPMAIEQSDDTFTTAPIIPDNKYMIFMNDTKPKQSRSRSSSDKSDAARRKVTQWNTQWNSLPYEQNVQGSSPNNRKPHAGGEIR